MLDPPLFTPVGQGLRQSLGQAEAPVGLPQEQEPTVAGDGPGVEGRSYLPAPREREVDLAGILVHRAALLVVAFWSRNRKAVREVCRSILLQRDGSSCSPSSFAIFVSIETMRSRRSRPAPNVASSLSFTLRQTSSSAAHSVADRSAIR